MLHFVLEPCITSHRPMGNMKESALVRVKIKYTERRRAVLIAAEKLFVVKAYGKRSCGVVGRLVFM